MVNGIASRPSTIGNLITSTRLTISLGQFSLNSHNDHTGLRNNLLLVCLVNVASQRRNQQGGQNSQNDQNNNQLDEGEALFVLQFLEHIVFLQNFL